MRQRQDHVIHCLGVQDRPQVGVAPQPLRLRPEPFLVVADDPQNMQSDVRPEANAVDDRLRELPGPDDDGVVEVIPTAPGNPERLAEDGARETHRGDREDPEVDDDETGELEGAEEKLHDGHQDQAAEGGSLGDVHPFGQMRPETPRAIEVEGPKGHGPHDHDRREEIEVGEERRNPEVDGDRTQGEAQVVGEHPAAGNQDQIADQRQLLQEPGVGSQHR